MWNISRYLSFCLRLKCFSLQAKKTLKLKKSVCVQYQFSSMERATQAWAETSKGGVVLSRSGMSLMISALQCKYSTAQTKQVIMFQ